MTMPRDEHTGCALRDEIAGLRARLAEAEDRLRASRGIEQELPVVENPPEPRSFALHEVGSPASPFPAAMLAHVSDAVIAIDLEERVIFLNPAAERQYGVGADEALGRRLTDLYEYRWVDPGDEAAARSALAERGEWRGENLHLTRAGRELRVESSVTMLRDASGAPIGMLATVRDVTAQRKMESVADSARRQVESIINNTPATVYAFDLEARFLLVNTAVAELLKTTPDELIGKRRHEFMPTEDAECYEANDRKVLEAGRALVFEERSHLPDRTVSWLTTKFPLRDAQGKIYAIAGISTEVTERKQAEEALRGRTEELETLLDALPAFVWISRDAECRVIVGNRAANELTRTEPGANISQSVVASGEAPYLRQLKEDGTEFQADELPLQRAIATGEPVRDAVLDFDFPDGRRVQALGTAVPLFDEAGRPRGGLAAFLDITARRRSEEALRERAGQLDLLARSSQRLIDCEAPDREVLAGIFGDIARLMGVECFYHFRADRVERCLHLETSAGLNDEERRLFASMKFGDLLCGRVAETNERIIVEDLQQSGQPGSEALHSAGAQSYAGFPLLDTRDRLLGTVAFVSRTRTHFRDGDVQMIETICGQVAATMERARLLRELRESQERTRLAAEATGVGIWEWNVANRTIRWDAQMFRLYGVAPTEDGLVSYETWRNAVHAEDVAEQEEALEETVRSRGQGTREFRILRGHDGECRWIRAVETVRTDASGATEWVIGTNLDITERRQATEALRASEARLALGVHVAGLALAEVDYSTGTYHLTVEAAQVLGLGETALVVPRETVHATFHPADRAELEQRIAASLDPAGRGGFEMVHRVVWPGGEVRWLRVRKLVSFSGEGADRRPVRAALAMLDVTVEKTAAELVRDSEEFVRGVLDSLPEHVVVLDDAGVVRTVNEPWRRFAQENGAAAPAVEVGVSYLEACRKAAAAGAESAAEALEGLQAVLSARQNYFAMEYPCHAPDRERWFLMQAQRALHGPPGVILSHVDITERKRAEDALREAAQRKDEFLAMLGHELRNPLNAIRHAVQIAHETPDDHEGCQWANAVIDRQSQQLARMVDDLLDVARINRGRIDLRPETLELATVLERATAVVRPLFAQRRHTFTSEVANQLRVTGDATRLEQVFVNILSNAAKYTPEQGHIALRAHRGDGLAVITVTDDGVGISAPLLPHVFDLFRQADSSLDRALGGLGIGLSVVKSLVEMHLGHVMIESAGPQLGTTVTVRLPLLLDLSTPDGFPTPPASTPPLASARRVLVVDDHEDAARALGRLLCRIGCEVRLAHSGPDGLAAAREFLPEVLLLDLGLPGCDGYEVTRTLRADPRFAGAFIVAISGYAQESDRARCLAEGFDEHFGKPLDFPRVAEAIRARCFA